VSATSRCWEERVIRRSLPYWIRMSNKRHAKQINPRCREQGEKRPRSAAGGSNASLPEYASVLARESDAFMWKRSHQAWQVYLETCAAFTAKRDARAGVSEPERCSSAGFGACIPAVWGERSVGATGPCGLQARVQQCMSCSSRVAGSIQCMSISKRCTEADDWRVGSPERAEV